MTGRPCVVGCSRPTRAIRRVGRTPPPIPTAARFIPRNCTGCCSGSRAPVLPGTGRAARSWCRPHGSSSGRPCFFHRPGGPRYAQSVDWQTVVGRDLGSGWRCRRRPPKTKAAKKKGHAGERVAWASKRDGEMFDFDYVDYHPGGSPSRDTKADGPRSRSRRGGKGTFRAPGSSMSSTNPSRSRAGTAMPSTSRIPAARSS